MSKQAAKQAASGAVNYISQESKQQDNSESSIGGGVIGTGSWEGLWEATDGADHIQQEDGAALHSSGAASSTVTSYGHI